MTSTFSTIVHFSMKDILEGMHKLNFLSTMECTNEIAFPRVKRRLLQCKEEGEGTFTVFLLCQIDEIVQNAKAEAKNTASKSGMDLQSYDDTSILSEIFHVLSKAVEENLYSCIICGKPKELANLHAAGTLHAKKDKLDLQHNEKLSENCNISGRRCVCKSIDDW